MTNYPTISFRHGNSALDEDEAYQREYRGDVIVKFSDGREFEVVILTPRRIAQELERTMEINQPYFAEAAMIVVPEVTAEAISLAVMGLTSEKFFESLVPKTSE